MDRHIVRVTRSGQKMTLPVTDEIKLNLGDQYYVTQLDSGEIVFTPLYQDIFSSPDFADLDFSQAEFDFGKFMGEEKLDD
ncbi:hypothetical protein [Fructilactobacillus frigidiflavus]|uniref:hypothetical protein n=1 Tax=Fructilactobacillus frigidiflavus TaxID=3242688 RepID=UPI003756A0CE